LARVHRVTYVGELGWEVYVSPTMAGHVFETLHAAGQDMDLKLCGMHMMDAVASKKASATLAMTSLVRITFWRRALALR